MRWGSRCLSITRKLCYKMAQAANDKVQSNTISILSNYALGWKKIPTYHTDIVDTIRICNDLYINLWWRRLGVHAADADDDDDDTIFFIVGRKPGC